MEFGIYYYYYYIIMITIIMKINQNINVEFGIWKLLLLYLTIIINNIMIINIILSL